MLKCSKEDCTGCSFVNLTKEHICSCKFKTIEEAIQDMNDRLRKGLIESYVVKGEMKQ